MPMPPSPNFLASGSNLLQTGSLQSANGLFNAVVLPNGTLAVFRGQGPGAGPLGNSGALWASGDLSAGTSGQYFLTMQPDGNLVVYEGVPPYNNNTPHPWASNTSKPVGKFPFPPYYLVLNNDGTIAVMCGSSPSATTGVNVWPSPYAGDPVQSFDITSFQYQLPPTPAQGQLPAGVTESQPLIAFSTHYANGSNTPQQVLFTYSAQLQTVSSWVLTTGVTIQVTTSLKVGLPIFAKGSIQVQVALQVTFQIGQSTTTSTTKTVQIPITVPANTKVTADFLITNVTLNVPYVMTGQATLQSGASFPATFNGTYVGVQDLNVDGKLSTEPYTGPTHFPLNGSVIVNPYRASKTGEHAEAAGH